MRLESQDKEFTLSVIQYIFMQAQKCSKEW